MPYETAATQIAWARHDAMTTDADRRVHGGIRMPTARTPSRSGPPRSWAPSWRQRTPRACKWLGTRSATTLAMARPGVTASMQPVHADPAIFGN